MSGNVSAGADALQAALGFAEAAFTTMRPACGTTLPSVVVTLQGVIQATEVAAQGVLDAVDRSSAAVERLRDRVAALASAPPSAPAGTREAWDDVSQSLDVLATAIGRIRDGMQFQDLTAQYVRATIDTVAGLNEQLVQVLAILSPVVDEEKPPSRLATKLGAPAMVAPWRQQLADLLMEERKTHTAAKATKA